MDLSDFDRRLSRPVRMRANEFQRDGRLKHVLFSAQFSRELLERLCRMADMIRELAKSKQGSDQLRNLLSHKRAMLYFTQPSTRTFLSFMAACQILGLTCNEVRDPSTSSEVKRESPLDSIRMFSSYFDLIIMRSKIPNFAECCGYLMNDLERQERRSVPIINGGAGTDQHPTQALLDVYTIQRTFQFDHDEQDRRSRFMELRKCYTDLTLGPDQKTYAFCGDLGRGRTVRSLVELLTLFDDIKLFFIAPEHDTLQLDPNLRRQLIDSGIEIQEFDSLDATINGKPVLEQIDCLYMTRIQREHNKGSESDEIDKIDLSHFRLSPERVARMKSYAPILHPFPRDSVVGEIPTVIDEDPRAMYFRQARNGMWARAALLVHLFDNVDDLHFMYNREFRELEISQHLR
ncbi:MAG: aspartate carbamoyltransferase [Planctomycetota bacterium]|nr:aspartate carbamoyltransferase [Planctomycetota bacterium]